MRSSEPGVGPRKDGKKKWRWTTLATELSCIVYPFRLRFSPNVNHVENHSETRSAIASHLYADKLGRKSPRQ
jgi:hypothetical protein